MNKKLSQKAPRAAAIVIHNQSILLMHRKKESQEYYCFPGGTVEPDETIEDAALRELYEETCVRATIARLLYQLTIIADAAHKKEFFYLCNYLSGVPALGKDSIEEMRMADGTNYYEPLWVDVGTLEKLLIYPPEISTLLIHDLKEGFSDDAKQLTVR